MSRVGKVLKAVLWTFFAVLVVIPVLFLAQCTLRDAYQQSELTALCDGADPGDNLLEFQKLVRESGFPVRSGGADGKDETEWFDREYLRIGRWLSTSRGWSGDYDVVFAKPGIGYYACVVTYEADRIDRVQFLDRAD